MSSNPCICDLKECGLILINPIRLPCESTICNEHVDINLNGFQCSICSEEHMIPEKGFPINKFALKILHSRIHFSKQTNEAIEMLDKLEKLIVEHDSINPESAVEKHFSNVRNKIDLDKAKIDEKYDNLINQSNEDEKRCRKLNESLSIQGLDLNELKNEQLIEWRKNLRIENFDTTQMRSQIDVKTNQIEEYINKVRNESLKNLKFKYSSIDLFVCGEYEDLINQKIVSLKHSITDFKYKIETGREVNALIELENNELAVGNYNNPTIYVWDLETKTIKFKLEGLNQGLSSPFLLLSNRDLVSGSHDNRIVVWDLNLRKMKYSLIGHNGPVTCLLELDNLTLASGSNDRQIIVWDLYSKTMKYKLLGNSYNISSLALFQNNELISGSAETSILVWSLQTRTAINRLSGHTSNVFCLLRLENGDLASGSYDKSIIVWDVQLRKVKYKLEGHNGIVYSLFQLKNGDLVSGSEDKSIIVWDLGAKKMKYQLEGHVGKINTLALLKNGMFLSGSEDGTIRVWDLDLKEV